jgi:Fe-S cluster assembly protein SufD
MASVMTDQDVYRTAFAEREGSEADQGPPWLRRLRQAAFSRFEHLGFPTARNEDWKFTSVAPLLRVPFRPAPAGARAGDLADITFPGALQLVFVNGRFAPELSALDGVPAGLTVTSLAAALRQRPALVEPHLARHARHEEQPFIALNTAFLQDGAVLVVGRGATPEKPVHLVYVSVPGGAPTVSYPRTLIVAEPGSRLTLVESYIGPAEEPYFTNGVTEVVVGEHATVDHYKLVRDGGAAFHIGALQVRLGPRSTFSSHGITMSGNWVRNEARAALDAEGCTCTLNGLYLAEGRQHVDNHTVIDHARPHCASHELYKGILGGHAHGVFNGKIFVRQDAQKTDAKQTNQTLLLSDDAVIDTKPQLEIFADDVKCTHGATVGQLDAEMIFYLRARGIGLEAARALLTYAFANDIIQRIQVDPVRARLEESLLARRRLPLDPPAEENA